MNQFQKKAKRLEPVIEVRKAKFDDENQKLIMVTQRKIETVSAMKEKQRAYMSGLNRLNDERGSINRQMLEALEIGLDSVKQDWMALYNAVLELEKAETLQREVMSLAHRDLEAIKHLKTKYEHEQRREEAQRDQKTQDEISLRKFSNAI